MSAHFTYKDPDLKSLCQGDLLYKTPELAELFSKVHPHYTKEDYRYFSVLTQSCDLVVRNGKCKATYLTLAAVRPLDLLIEREIKSYQKTDQEKIAGICDQSAKGLLQDFLRKLLNNNSTDYFYYHDDAKSGIQGPHVCFLRLSVALRGPEHYEKCLKAKVLELNDTFKAKLGWLVGNMYSRVGTDDWAPLHKTDDEFSGIVSNLLESRVVWSEPKRLKEFRKTVSSNLPNESDPKKLIQYLEGLEVKNPKKQFEEQLEAILKRIIGESEPKSKELLNAIRIDPVISELIRK